MKTVGIEAIRIKHIHFYQIYIFIWDKVFWNAWISNKCISKGKHLNFLT